MKKGLHKIIKEEGHLISLSTSSITKYEERISQDNQRERPFDFFVDHFFNKCEIGTIRENKDECLLISLSTSSKQSVKKGLHIIIKEEGLLISLSTSSKTKYEERTSQENQRGRPLDFFVDQF